MKSCPADGSPRKGYCSRPADDGGEEKQVPRLVEDERPGGHEAVTKGKVADEDSGKVAHPLAMR